MSSWVISISRPQSPNSSEAAAVRASMSSKAMVSTAASVASAPAGPETSAGPGGLPVGAGRGAVPGPDRRPRARSGRRSEALDPDALDREGEVGEEAGDVVGEARRTAHVG